jgi:hypothetical protein
VRIKRKEIYVAIILSALVALLTIYSSVRNEEPRFSSLLSKSGSTNQASSLDQGFQYSQVITETIEGELNRGTFEDAVNKLQILTEQKEGYVKSLRMTYTEKAWSGQMICKLPPTNVTSFAFSVRAIIEANGTVTYINISIENVNASQLTPEDAYSTVNLNLKEKPENGAAIQIPLGPVLSFLATSLLWIGEGLIVGIPLSFASLGIVILVNRGIVPLWKNTLKKTGQPRQA